MAEVTYYFNARGDAVWTNPNNMVDGATNTYGSTSSDGATQLLNANDCPGTDLGTITKVELRAYGYGDADDRIDLGPYYNGIAGAVKQTTPGSTPAWGAYQDIFTDMVVKLGRLPVWTDIQGLDCNVIFAKVSKGNTMYCARVEFRVTYVLYPEPPTNFASPSQTPTTIDLTWTKGVNSDKTLIRFRDDQYPTSETDGYQAYFDTGESVTVDSGEQSIIQAVSNSARSLGSIWDFRVGERVNDFPVANISRVSFNLYKVGSPTGTAYVRVRRVSDDSILGTIGTIDVSTIATTPAWYDFDGSVDNPTKQDLRFTVEYDGVDAVNVRHQNTDVLANAVSTYYTAAWVDESAWDSAVKIYYSVPLTPGTTYYFRAWGYQSLTLKYSTTTADLTQATSGIAIPPRHGFVLFQEPAVV